MVPGADPNAINRLMEAHSRKHRLTKQQTSRPVAQRATPLAALFELKAELDHSVH